MASKSFNNREVFALNWDEARAEGICLIEWPEKAKEYLTPPYISVDIAPQEEDIAAAHATAGRRVDARLNPISKIKRGLYHVENHSIQRC